MRSSKHRTLVVKVGIAGVVLFEAGPALTLLRFHGAPSRIGTGADHAIGWTMGTGAALLPTSATFILARRSPPGSCRAERPDCKAWLWACHY